MPEDKLAELMILVEAVGVDKAIQSLEKAEKGLGDTAKKAKSDTKALEQFGTKFAGAMAIITASIAGAVGALLVQMPIMQEIFDALAYLIETLAYVMDGILRPILDKVVDGIYWLANKFEELPKPIQIAIVAIIVIVGVLAALVAIAIVVIGVIASVIASIVTIIGAIAAGGAAFIGIIVVIGGTITTLVMLVTTVTTVIAIIGTLVLVIAGIAIPIALVVAAIYGLAKLFEWAWPHIKELASKYIDDTMDDFNKFVGFIMEWGPKVVGTILDFFTGLGTTIWDAIDLEGKFTKGWEALKSGVNAFTSFLTGIGSTIADTFKGIVNSLITTLNKAIDAINGISVSIPDWVPVYGGKTFSTNIAKIPSLQKQGIIEQTGIAEVHEGEGVFAMRTLQDAMYNAMVMAGLDRAKDVNVYLDGHLVGRIMGDELNRDFGSQGAGF